MTTIEDVVAQVEETGDPYVILRDGDAVAVVVRPDRWRALVDAVHGGGGGN